MYWNRADDFDTNQGLYFNLFYGPRRAGILKMLSYSLGDKTTVERVFGTLHSKRFAAIFVGVH